MSVRLKICGMKHNVAEVARLHPDYLGFIFYEKSPRNFEGEIPNIPNDISRVGVFVNATFNFITQCIEKHRLEVVQLHGDETPAFCEQLRNKVDSGIGPVHIWKVFHILDSFNFDELTPYENYVDAFLFDTKSSSRGGSGLMFDWRVLKDYTSEKPFVLSGGIGLDEMENLKEITRSGAAVMAVDINSRFEKEPGLKDTELIKRFSDELSRE